MNKLDEHEDALCEDGVVIIEINETVMGCVIIAAIILAGIFIYFGC